MISLILLQIKIFILTIDIMKKIFGILLSACAMLPFASCTEDYSAPQIDSVWINMVSQPVEEIICAYPKQTICLHGSGFGTLSRLIVNKEDINLNTLYVYETDNFITFTLPSDINTVGDNIRVVTDYGMCDYNFVIRPLEEQPTIPDFNPSLVAGTVSTIYGTNLSGAYMITLPLTYGNSVDVACTYNAPDEDAGIQESVSFTVPSGVEFATGQYIITMFKTDEARGITYTEKVYSSTITYVK